MHKVLRIMFFHHSFCGVCTTDFSHATVLHSAAPIHRPSSRSSCPLHERVNRSNRRRLHCNPRSITAVLVFAGGPADVYIIHYNTFWPAVIFFHHFRLLLFFLRKTRNVSHKQVRPLARLTAVAAEV